MSLVTSDTLKFVETQEKNGVLESQTKAHAFSVVDTPAALATKDDFKLAISELRADLIKWVVGLALVQMALLVGILMKLPH